MLRVSNRTKNPSYIDYKKIKTQNTTNIDKIRVHPTLGSSKTNGLNSY